MIEARAAVTERPGRIRVHEVPPPEPGAVPMKMVMAANGCD
jgi:hypothetical protein